LVDVCETNPSFEISELRLVDQCDAIAVRCFEGGVVGKYIQVIGLVYFSKMMFGCLNFVPDSE
jgi:hypothetical protein